MFHSRYGAIDPLGSFYQNKFHFKSSWACGWDVEMCSVAELEGRVNVHEPKMGTESVMMYFEILHIVHVCNCHKRQN